MMFETEESGVRRYMGTITGISDLDPVRWKNSQWRNLQVSLDAANLLRCCITVFQDLLGLVSKKFADLSAMGYYLHILSF